MSTIHTTIAVLDVVGYATNGFLRVRKAMIEDPVTMILVCAPHSNGISKTR